MTSATTRLPSSNTLPAWDTKQGSTSHQIGVSPPRGSNPTSAGCFGFQRNGKA